MGAYYNEIDAYAAHWLRNLIAEGLIAKGDVDERSICDVAPEDLYGYTQCHFFAGAGGWSHALRLAGWPDDRPIWTGSCPCQPFSVAGKGLGADDPRHLWPHFHRLIAARRPPVVFGEQVAGAAGYGWLDGVRSDLAGENYSCEAFDIPACAVDAPHIRQRLYWCARDMADDHVVGRENERSVRLRRAGVHDADVRRERDGGRLADATHGGWREERADAGGGSAGDRAQGRAAGSDAGRLDDADDARLEGHARDGGHGRGRARAAGSATASGRGDMADADDAIGRPDGAGRHVADRQATGWHESASDVAGRRNGTFWSDAIWLTGADGKARRAQPGLPLLAHGIPARVGRLRAYGNAIVPQLAAEVIGAFLDTET